MTATLLMAASAVVLLALGTLHLVFTFFGTRLSPRDPALKARMAEVSPGITSHASMWSFWVGFNVSHSMAAMLFGLVYGYLAIAHAGVLFSSPYLLIVGLATLVALCVVAKTYWFRSPLIGIGISLACYVASMIVALPRHPA